MNNQQPKRATQKEIAAICDIKYQSVQRWLKGIALPDSQNLQKLAEYFGVSIDYLLMGKGGKGDVSSKDLREKVSDQDRILAIRIIEERARLGYLQQEFADKIKVEIENLENYELGKNLSL